MGIRSRLFASAAFPLLSITLIFQPANAAVQQGQTMAAVTNGRAVVATESNDGAIVEMAQDQSQQAPDGQSDQDPRKRKKHGGAEPDEQQGQKHQAAPAQQGEGEPQRHKMKEGQAAGQPDGQPEQPKPHRQQSQQEAQPVPAAPQEAQPKQKPQALSAEEQQAQPEQKKPHKQSAQQPQPPAEPDVTQQPKAVQPPAAPQGETQQGQVEPKKHQKPADQAPAKETAPQQASPAQQPAGETPHAPKTPAQKAQQAQPENGTAEQTNQGMTGKPPRQKPDGDKAHAKPQQNELQQGEQQPMAVPGKAPAQNGQAEGQQAQPQIQTAPQQPNTETVAPAPKNANPAAPAAGAAQQGGQAPANPSAAQVAPAGSGQVSPQELERRKKIAENPAASNETVVLPVQNGAAVLDSDKDAARRGHHQGGRNGAQGQMGQGQIGQGQMGQGQMGQGQGNPRQPMRDPNAQAQQAPVNVKAPTSDADAQRWQGDGQRRPIKIEAVTSEQGRRLDRRPDFVRPDGAEVQMRNTQDNRVILNVDNNFVVRHDDTERFTRDGERPTYEQLSRDRYRETIDRPDGDRVVTVRNRYGDIVQRSRIDARGREYVLFYSPELEDQPDHDDYFRDPGDDLPPMRLRIPLNQYIIDTGTDREADYYDFLREPPVEPVERVYSLNEVRYSARIRDKVRRIDLDTITFATGSAEIPMSQASTLRGVADAIGKIVKKDPTETFLIEGHTDAVGTPESNLILSDQRAESVANVLSDVYGIPPENLTTQGYGEQYLKVDTQGPEQENRRVTIRRVTALVRPVASNQ